VGLVHQGNSAFDRHRRSVRNWRDSPHEFVIGKQTPLPLKFLSSNSLAFCTSCHEMEAYVYPEYQQSAHYQNAAGVRAVCADCHVPKALGPKIVRKVQATFKELPGHLMGIIDTREKFEAHRAEMATSVWKQMRANDSQECRSCHSYDAMAQDMQDRSAARKHSAEWRERFDDTCIDCHFGIAHEAPDGLTPDDLAQARGS